MTSRLRWCGKTLTNNAGWLFTRVNRTFFLQFSSSEKFVISIFLSAAAAFLCDASMRVPSLCHRHVSKQRRIDGRRCGARTHRVAHCTLSFIPCYIPQTALLCCLRHPLPPTSTTQSDKPLERALCLLAVLNWWRAESITLRSNDTPQ